MVRDGDLAVPCVVQPIHHMIAAGGLRCYYGAAAGGAWLLARAAHNDPVAAYVAGLTEFDPVYV